MTHRLILTLLLLAPPLALVPARADAQRRDDDRDRDAYRARIDTTIAFGRGGTVDVGGLAVDVVVGAWDRQEVRVRAYAEHGRYETSYSASRVSLRVEPEGGDRRRGRIGDARVELTVPEGTRVRATTTAGDITVTNTRGEVELSANAGDVTVRGARGLATMKTLAGDVDAAEMDGDVAASTGIGDLVLHGVRGDVRATTVGGDMELTGIIGRTVVARSTSGDVAYAGVPDAGGRYEFASHSGDVVLVLPPDTRADVAVQTYKGSLDTAFPVVIGGGGGTSRPRVFEFAIGGGGGARLRVETFSGDVVLRHERDGGKGEKGAKGEKSEKGDRDARRRR